jgi:hypothetical protein
MEIPREVPKSMSPIALAFFDAEQRLGRSIDDLMILIENIEL